MTHRRGAAGARGDEADLHGAARAGHRRHRHRRGGRGPSTSAPTSARCPRPGSWPRPWWRWCSPTPCSRSSAATASPRPRRNLAGLPRRRARAAAHVVTAVAPEPVRPRRAAPLGSSSARPGAGKTTVGRALAALLGVPFHDTDERSSARRAADRRDLRRRRRGGLPGAGARGGARRRSAERRACSPSAAVRLDSQPEVRDLLGGAPRRLPRRDHRRRRRARIGFDALAAAAARSTRARRGSR